MEPEAASTPTNASSTTSNNTHDPSTCLALIAGALTSNPDSFHLSYLAEGNANVIYTLHANPSHPAAPASITAHLSCSVLRMRKALAFTKPSIEVLSAFRTRIKPLFTPDHSSLLLEQVLVKLNPGIVRGLNEILHAMESGNSQGKSDQTPKMRHVGSRGVFHPEFEEEAHGILMPNLDALGGQVVEFKPKWLVQSPSAPEGARRCRTCAVNLLRRMEGKHKGRGDGGFCPFALVSADREVLEGSLRRMDRGALGAGLQSEFVIKVQPALAHLQRLQKRHGEVGLEDFRNPEEKDFGVAMALRDCSVFLVISEDAILDLKFADLDLKTTDGGKVERWAEIEQELISKRMYTDAGGDGSHPCHWKNED